MNETTTPGNLWFFRGAACGFLLFAAINALSWFWLSEAWSDLCGATMNAGADAIGFPFEIWREGNHYGSGWMIDYSMLSFNLLIASAASAFAGLLFKRNGDRLEELLQQHAPSEKHTLKLTFSVKGLLIATTIAALSLGITRALGFSPWLLGAIYFTGPLVLILIAMAPVGLHWEQRMVILVFFAVLMLALSVVTGMKLGMEFDRVLIGVFICWVPQSVFAATLITAWIWFTSSLHQEQQSLPAKV